MVHDRLQSFHSMASFYAHDPLSQKANASFCFKIKGPTSLGRRTCPDCNYVILEIPLNKKNMVLT